MFICMNECSTFKKVKVGYEDSPCRVPGSAVGELLIFQNIHTTVPRTKNYGNFGKEWC